MRHPVLAMIAVWVPTEGSKTYNATLPGFSGVNTGGYSLDECVEDIQDALNMINVDVKVGQEHLESLANPIPTFTQQDIEDYSTCWFRTIVLEAEIEDGVVFDDEYIARLSIYIGVTE